MLLDVILFLAVVVFAVLYVRDHLTITEIEYDLSLWKADVERAAALSVDAVRAHLLAVRSKITGLLAKHFKL